MSEAMLARPGTAVISGVNTDALIEGDPPSFWVQWINWDSDFRRELRINDKITAVNGRSLSDILKPQKTFKGIGQAGEGQLWAEMGLTAGQQIELSIVRDEQPMTVRGKLGVEMFYFDGDGKAAIGPGGPARLARDSFASPWSAWQEQIQRAMTIIFTRAWTDRIPTRTELASLLQQRPRIEHLTAKYPGPLAEAMRGDWERAVELLRGRKADPPVNLEFREVGRRRVAFAKEAAAKAWKAVLEETAAQRIPASPAVSPLDRKEAVGKLVELPAITPDDFFNSFDKVFAAAGSRADGYWFLMLERPEFHEFFRTIIRFQGSVNPQVKERYRFLTRVLDDPWMLPVDGKPTMAVTLELIAGLAGDDEMFVDVRSRPAKFAGEQELSVFEAVPRDDSSPQSVMEAMIHAVKAGDEVGWRSLFAPWRTLTGRGGRPIVDLSFAADARLYASAWDLSRRNIMGDVHDARVARVERVRRILSRDGTGLPDIDQVVVWVDHYGLFDGEHRTFQNASVNRRWPLQRIDGGPWRIAAIQTL